MNGSPFFRSYVSPRSRARLTKALLIAGAIVSVVSMVAGALELIFPTFDPEAEIQDNPGGLGITLLLAGLGVLQILIYIVTVICFLRWLYRSYKNLESFAIPTGSISYSAGWAVGSFFIPFVNLVVPYRAIKELWRNSAANALLRNASPPAYFPLWWLFWLLAGFASRIYYRISFREDISREVIAIGGVLGAALTTIAAIFAVVVVEEITRRQEEASSSLGLAQPPSYPPPPPTFEARPLAPPIVDL